MTNTKICGERFKPSSLQASKLASVAAVSEHQNLPPHASSAIMNPAMEKFLDDVFNLNHEEFMEKYPLFPRTAASMTRRMRKVFDVVSIPDSPHSPAPSDSDKAKIEAESWNIHCTDPTPPTTNADECNPPTKFFNDHVPEKKEQRDVRFESTDLDEPLTRCSEPQEIPEQYLKALWSAVSAAYSNGQLSVQELEAVGIKGARVKEVDAIKHTPILLPHYFESGFRTPSDCGVYLGNMLSCISNIDPSSFERDE